MKKNRWLFICMIVTICAFINEISVIGLIMFAIGFSTVVTMLEMPLVYGERYMKKIPRRVCLLVGELLTIIAFIGEISWVAFAMFTVGFMLTTFLLNQLVEEKEK